MIWKLLLTALVIAGAVLAIRLRTRNPGVEPSSRRLPPASGTESAIKTPLLKFAAFGLVGLMLVGLGSFLYYQWQDTYQVVTVHVIDTRTGNEATYEAYKGDVEGRTFVTVTGRQVNLAEVERMELGEK